jgi:hypothetical protein
MVANRSQEDEAWRLQPAEGPSPRSGRSTGGGSPFRTGSWSDARNPVPEVLMRVLGHRSPPRSGSPRRTSPRYAQPELEVVLAAEEDAYARSAHEGAYGRSVRRLDNTHRAANYVAEPPRSPARHSRSYPRSPARVAARSPTRSPRYSHPSLYSSPARSYSAATPQLPRRADSGGDYGDYVSGLGLVSEHVATLQMERAVLATRVDAEGRRRLAGVEAEMRAMQAAIRLARSQIVTARPRSHGRRPGSVGRSVSQSSRRR